MVDVLTIRSRMREAFQTFRTLERLLAGVKATMFRQVVFVLESLVAVGALVRTRVWKKRQKLLKFKIQGMNFTHNLTRVLVFVTRY